MNVSIPCPCPGSAHPDGDTVTFRDRLDFTGAIAMRNAVLVLQRDDPGSGEAEILAVIAEASLIHGITAWTLVDEKRKPIDVSKSAIREHLLSKPDIAMAASDGIDATYQEQVLGPLAQWAQRFSPRSQTDESTSAANGSVPTHPKRSSRSSTTTTPTAATATTSPALVGASN